MAVAAHAQCGADPEIFRSRIRIASLGVDSTKADSLPWFTFDEDRDSSGATGAGLFVTDSSSYRPDEFPSLLDFIEPADSIQQWRARREPHNARVCLFDDEADSSGHSKRKAMDTGKEQGDIVLPEHHVSSAGCGVTTTGWRIFAS
jgi:hypothetical protein